MMKDRIYTCVICKSLNSVHRHHCATCGTTPAEYSWSGKPIRESEEALKGSIEVVVAYGCERVDTFRVSKAHMRTVPMDYYADV